MLVSTFVAERLEVEKVLFRFYHEPRKYETQACTPCGCAERLEVEKVLFRFYHEPRKYETEAYIFGGCEEAFWNGRERVEATGCISLRFRISEVRDKSERGLSHSKRSAQPPDV